MKAVIVGAGEVGFHIADHLSREGHDVFVVEQDCPYMDIDGLDRNSRHLLGRDAEGLMRAYLRLTEPGYKYEEPAIGRVVTDKTVRGTGTGGELMQRGVEEAERLFPGRDIKLSAQVYAREFYEKFGFRQVSQPYDEDGIMLIAMVRRKAESK